MENSKPLKRTDESATRLVINTLNGKNAYGINIDTIFKTKKHGYVLLEFLKCESKYVNGCQSHPRRYWKKNWRKFVRLWEIAKKLDAKFILVNYEEPALNSYANFRIMEVDMNVKPSEDRIVKTRDIVPCGKFEDFKKFYLELNEDHTDM